MASVSPATSRFQANWRVVNTSTKPQNWRLCEVAQSSPSIAVTLRNFLSRHLLDVHFSRFSRCEVNDALRASGARRVVVRRTKIGEMWNFLGQGEDHEMKRRWQWFIKFEKRQQMRNKYFKMDEEVTGSRKRSSVKVWRCGSRWCSMKLWRRGTSEVQERTKKKYSFKKTQI